jgi:hypothetical protein
MKPILVSLTAIALVCVAACSRWSDEDEQFVRAYTEVLIAREQQLDTASANGKVAAILTQHGFTERSFRKRFQELTAKPEHLRQILDSARNRARRIADDEQQRERTALEEKKKSDSLAVVRDTNHVK